MEHVSQIFLYRAANEKRQDNYDYVDLEKKESKNNKNHLCRHFSSLDNSFIVLKFHLSAVKFYNNKIKH